MRLCISQLFAWGSFGWTIIVIPDQVSGAVPPVVTDEGYELIPDTEISCWEALEMKAL